MQKLIFPLLLVFTFVTQSKAQQRLFDQAVQLKTCNISIEANPFIATTVVEMEFYNPKDQEVEGLHTFQLNRGQVITDFQLELNGKYREGSIEEQWKARQAYSSIVGKRIDPAILQMNGRNNYRLNIYPIAAKSSRKIKFTITQMMVEENLKLSYTLPLDIKSTTEKFSLDIKVSRPASIPYANTGLLENQLFSMHNDEATLWQHENDVILNKPISFSISQFANKPQFCINNKNGINNFIMRFYPDVARYYQSKTKTINVYWDVSLSGKERNLSKEIDFLEKYITENDINKTTIFLFNHQLQGLIVFNRGKDNFTSIRNYLLTYKYAGATELGILDFSNVLADAVLLFSDGINSIGKAKPKLGAVPVNFITSAYYYYNSYYNNYQYNDNDYKNIVGNTGGSVIRLYYNSVASAVKRIDTAENFLFKYNSGNIHINESFPVKLGGSVLLSGTINQADNLELFYGNNSLINKSENYFIPVNENCDETTFKKMKMLKAYDSLMYDNYNYYWNWHNMIVFGLTERVVTPQTSFLVLERIEDYIKYKIAPPKELEAKCAEMNYVYRSEYKIKALKSFTEQESLESVVKEYNKRINWWSKTETPIDLNRVVPDKQPMDVAAATNTVSGKVAGVNVQNNFMQDVNVSGGLKEVVVTSAFGIKRTARSTSSSVQNLTTEQVNIIRQVNVNDALAGKIAGAQVRSQSIAKLGAETTIRLRGENGLGVATGALYILDGTIMPSAADINPDNIEDYTILQGPAAAALFGPDGANGAIVMTGKKAKRTYPTYVWSEYKLSSCKDEDYLQEMKNTEDHELSETFVVLEKQNKMDVGFYFEMANFFFEKGKTDKAAELMYDAIELSRGRAEGLKLAAYLYEKWKWLDKAIAVYKGILSQNENNLLVKRDLALAYFQHKDFANAVKTYYSIITATDEYNNYGNVKENALAEMNAILALHKNEFDISYINQNLIKMVPVDLRITVESNYDYTGKVQFVEPDNAKCNVLAPNTVNKGRYTGNDYYYSNSLSEYAIKDALTGKYRVKVDSYNNYSSAAQVPVFIRVITFKNFHKENMEMEVKIFDLDNQYGVVELDEVSW
jgi:tetratricopeptide (TPR) repeat protein